MTVLCVLNPTAGRGGRRLTDKVAALLRAKGVDVELRQTQVRGDAERLARAAAARDPALAGGKVRVIAVAGGDGTINEVANGILGSDIPIAVIPSGTANVLAHEIGMKARADRIVDTILNGKSITCWPGTLDGRCFVAMVGAGFDARTVAAVSSGIKQWIGKGAYGLAGLPVFFQANAPLYRVIADNQSFDAAWVVVSKTQYYAGRYVIAPGASLTEPTLRVFLLEEPGRLALLRTLLGIAMGRVEKTRGVRLMDCKSVKISRLNGSSEGADSAPDPIEADGDLAGTLPAEIAVAPKNVKILTPSDG